MKKFLIVGNMNAITYKEIFPFIKENRLWLGGSWIKEFIQPDGIAKSFGNICWYTNLEHNKRYVPLDLYKRYTPEEYPRYDNYDAIEVSNTCDIPMDYDGVMGVPITFLDKWCPEQFEIVWTSDRGGDGMLDSLKKSNWDGLWDSAFVEGKKVYKRILIRHKQDIP